MEISCAFVPNRETAEHISLAERLGYRRAWCYDSPAVYPDVWMVLALAAQRTSRIEIGPGVLIPSLRHPLVTAAAAAFLAELAPGRVVLAVGSGFSGRLAMGQKPLRWSWVQQYIRTLRALLRGEEVEWEGGMIKMLHLPGYGATRPLEPPLLVGAAGPKGFAVAREVADGVFVAGDALPEEERGHFRWVTQLSMGTVLDEGEPPTSQRALAAAGHTGALAYHGAWERGRVEALPGGAEWLRQLEGIPERSHHLYVHEGHLIEPNERDRPFVTAELVARLGRAATADEWRTRLQQLEAQGVTEIAYQPAGPDIPRELIAFVRMAGVQPAG